MGHNRPPSDDGLEHDAMVSAAGGSGPSEEPESPTLDRVLEPAPTSGGAPATPYRLLQRIGVGGMGEVWLAEQSGPIRRRVALKLIRGGFGSKEVIARFESERQALAMMDHPGIARVYEAGTSQDGLPYFAMEHVQGEAIHTHCDRARATVRDRIELMIEVCSAVQHAHRKAIIHRDLKPSNILVTVQDGQARPKVIDFGVAKAVGQKLTDQTMYTALGQVVGTLEYMSPEQAEMTAQDVDTRTDVYALGVVLYQLLVGALPFDSKEIREAGYDEARRRIREVDPPRPSTRVSSLGEASSDSARMRRVEVATLERELRGDLDWITMKALEKDRTRRYGSPEELAADLRRFLDNQPILARPPSALYRARKFARRHRVGVAFAALLLLSLITLAGTATWQARKVAAERDRANREAQAATAALGFLTDLFEISDPGEARGNTITAREVLDRGAAEIAESFEDQPEVQARLLGTIGDVYQSLGLYQPAEESLRAALDVRRRAADPLELAAALDALGRLLRDRAEYQEAETLIREGLALRRRELGDEHADVLRSLHSLAVVLWSQGRDAEAEPIYRDGLAMSRLLLAPNDPLITAFLNGMGNVLVQLERPREAEPFYREVLERRRARYDGDHPDVAFALDNLAMCLHDLGELDAAEPLYFEAQEMLFRVYGTEHPEIAQTLDNVAFFLVDKGDYARAEEMTRKSLELNRKLLGEDHPRFGDNLLALADILLHRGGVDEAEELTLRALHIYRASLPPDHLKITGAESMLGAVRTAQGRFEEAEALVVGGYEKMVRQKERAPERRRGLETVIQLYEAWGRPEEAARYRALLPAQ
jgi:non-specific serine/threonine protein kinase/serine/threonine-protein kinase